MLGVLGEIQSADRAAHLPRNHPAPLIQPGVTPPIRRRIPSPHPVYRSGSLVRLSCRSLALGLRGGRAPLASCGLAGAAAGDVDAVAPQAVRSGNQGGVPLRSTNSPP